MVEKNGQEGSITSRQNLAHMDFFLPSLQKMPNKERIYLISGHFMQSVELRKMEKLAISSLIISIFLIHSSNCQQKGINSLRKSERKWRTTTTTTTTATTTPATTATYADVPKKREVDENEEEETMTSSASQQETTEGKKSMQKKFIP